MQERDRVAGNEGHRAPYARPPRALAGVVSLAVLALGIGACRGGSSAPPRTSELPKTPVPATAAEASRPYPTGFDFAGLKARVDWRAHMLATGVLDEGARASMERGKALFARAYAPETGLGPFFNNLSCVACHNQPGLLGHGTVDVATHMYAGLNVLDDSDDSRNPRLMPRHTAAGHAPFKMPADFALAGDRVSPQLLGLGWIEAVPGEQILAQPHLATPEPGKHFEPMGWVPEKKEGAHGTMRFGLKPGVATIDEFIIGALAAELGITTPNRAFDHDDDATPDPEITTDAVIDLANYVALTPSPARALPAEHTAGLARFRDIGCAGCHWSSFSVEGKATPQLYSDLMVHDLGPERADARKVESSPPEYSRTTPLWALHLYGGPFLHDGKAATLEQAILLHAGEGKRSREAFVKLDAKAKATLLAALKEF